MRQFLCPFTFLVVAALTAGACNNSTEDPPTTPTTPTPPEITEPAFTGTLTPNGGITQVFSVSNVGSGLYIHTVLTELDNNPDDTPATVGLALGTWNGATCQLILVQTAITKGAAVTGFPQLVGQYCWYVSDAAGKLVAPVNFSVEIKHY